VRTLKSIANNKELGLSIHCLELTHYTESQLDLLYKHDIEYDESIPPDEQLLKPLHMKEAFYKLFRESKAPVVQFLATGPYAISKM
jgi:hypothetical protein